MTLTFQVWMDEFGLGQIELRYLGGTSKVCHLGAASRKEWDRRVWRAGVCQAFFAKPGTILQRLRHRFGKGSSPNPLPDVM